MAERYVPLGLIGLLDFVNTMGRFRFGDAWVGQPRRNVFLLRRLESARDHAVEAATGSGKVVSRWTVPATEEVEIVERAVEADRVTFVEKTKLWDRAVKDVRDACYQGVLEADVKAETPDLWAGTLIRISPHFWGNDGVARPAFEEGYIEIPHARDTWSGVVTGDVFVGKVQVETYIKGLEAKDPRRTLVEDVDVRVGTIAAETRCVEWLVSLMSTGATAQARAHYKAEATSKFGVGTKAFGRAWEAAKLSSGNPHRWGTAGRKRKDSQP